ERGLVEGHRDVDREVVRLALEDLVGAHLHHDEQVAGRAALLTRTALAAQADLLAVLHPRGDAGLDGAVGDAVAAAVADRADLVVDELPAVAGRAGLVHHEAAAHRRGHLARDVAGRADVRPGARLAAGALAVRAGRVGAQPQ